CSAAPYIGDESKKLTPTFRACSTSARALFAAGSPFTSKGLQVPIPITGTCKLVSPSFRCSIDILSIFEFTPILALYKHEASKNLDRGKLIFLNIYYNHLYTMVGGRVNVILAGYLRKDHLDFYPLTLLNG